MKTQKKLAENLSNTHSEKSSLTRKIPSLQLQEKVQTAQGWKNEMEKNNR